MAGGTPSDWQTHRACEMKTMAQRVDVLECLDLGTRHQQFAATSPREGGRVHPSDWVSCEAAGCAWCPLYFASCGLPSSSTIITADALSPPKRQRGHCCVVLGER